MKNVIIIGAGGFGREIESYLTNDSNNGVDFQLIGYLDKNQNSLKGKTTSLKIIGSEDSYLFKENDYVILGVAGIELKHKIVKKLKIKDVKFLTFVAENVFVGIGVTIGEGSVVGPNVIIPNNTMIGSFVTININSTIGHDSRIGDFCSIMPSVNIGGETIIGSDVFIGTNANISPRIEISNNVFVGIGSTVLKNITEVGGTYFGNPARKMR